MDTKASDIKKFWEGYRKAVVGTGVSENVADWYVQWAMAFAVSIKGRPMRERTREDVEGFLAALAKEENIRKWQVREAFDALKVLYHGYLGLPLAFENPAAEKPDACKARIHGSKAN